MDEEAAAAKKKTEEASAAKRAEEVAAAVKMKKEEAAAAKAEKAATVQIKLDDLMKGKVLNFKTLSWDLDAIKANAPILNGLAAILKEAPQLAINIHGKQETVKHTALFTKDAITKKTFAECFPGIENNVVRQDQVARSRALSTLKALKELGCTNTMTVSHEASNAKQITFQVLGVPAANGGTKKT